MKRLLFVLYVRYTARFRKFAASNVLARVNRKYGPWLDELPVCHERKQNERTRHAGLISATSITA